MDTCKECQWRLEEAPAGEQLGLDGFDMPASPDTDVLHQRMSDLKSNGLVSADVAAGQSSTETNLTDIQPWLSRSRSTGGAQHVDQYVLGTCIGRGGMGIVFHARDTKLDRDVAFKFMSPALLSDSKAADRFLREAKAAAAISHPNVVTIHAVGEFFELPYLVMELVRGESLSDCIATRKLSVGQIVNIGQMVASGLNAAHESHVQHRDIKPANLLLQAGSAEVKIVDFGLARPINSQALTQTGTMVGTPEFMAPEQMDASCMVDQRCDLFSLGAVLYACLAGQSPFAAPSTLASLKAVCLSQPKPIQAVAPHTPEWLAKLTMRLLEKDPAARPQTAQEILDTFKLHGFQLHRTPTPPAPPEQNFASNVSVALNQPEVSRIRRRRRSASPWPVLTSVIAAASLLVALGLALSQPGKSSSGSVQPEREVAGSSPAERSAPLNSSTAPRLPQPIAEHADSRSEPEDGATMQWHQVSSTKELGQLLETHRRAPIEIRLNGDEFHWPATTISDRTIVISCAPGRSPLLIFEGAEDEPAFTSVDSQIHFTGLRMEVDGVMDDDAPLAGLLQFEQSDVTIENCTLMSDTLIPCIALHESSASITQCNFQVPNSTSIQWHPDDDQELWLEDNAFVTDIMLECAGMNGKEIVLTNNRFAGSIAIEFNAEDRHDDDSSLRVRMIDNVLAATQAAWVIYGSNEIGRNGRRLSRFSCEGTNNTYPRRLAILIKDEDEIPYSSFDALKALVRFEDESSRQQEHLLGMDPEELEFRLERNEMSVVDLRELELE